MEIQWYNQHWFSWRGRKDSNPQPSDPKSDALSSWATPAVRKCMEEINVFCWIWTWLSGASEGIWTLDHWNHNPALYHLSYARHSSNTKGLWYYTLWGKTICTQIINHSHKSFTFNLAFTHSYVHYDFYKIYSHLLWLTPTNSSQSDTLQVNSPHIL